jgi:hypothetical protein
MWYRIIKCLIYMVSVSKTEEDILNTNMCGIFQHTRNSWHCWTQFWIQMNGAVFSNNANVLSILTCYLNLVNKCGCKIRYLTPYCVLFLPTMQSVYRNLLSLL